MPLLPHPDLAHRSVWPVAHRSIRGALLLLIGATSTSCTPQKIPVVFDGGTPTLTDAPAVDAPAVDAPAVDASPPPASDVPFADSPPADVQAVPGMPCIATSQCRSGGLVCDLARGSCVECVAGGDCATNQYCDPAAQRCRADVCAPGAARCLAGSPGAREVCNADGSAFEARACELTQSCRDGACVDRICQPAASRCSPGSLTARELCAADGLSWLAAAECSSGESCSLGACVLRICAPGATRCASTQSMARCADDGLTWQPAMECPAGNACDATTGVCRAWACMPESVSCQGNSRVVCSADGLTATSTPCSARQTCAAAACAEWVCDPGTPECVGLSSRRVCNADGLGYSDAPCPAMNTCLGSGSCTPWVCSPASVTCRSASARGVCSADGQGYSMVACASGESCLAGGCAVRCGDGVIGAAEACDDGNTANGDGCSSVCAVEPPPAPVWRLIAEWPLDVQPAGAIVANGAYGGQGVTTLGGARCWNQTSDWNYLWITHPAPAAARVRVEVDVYANTSLWGISLVPLVDGPRYRPDTYVVNGVGLGSSFDGTGSTTVSSTVNYVGTLLGRLTSPLQVRGAWVTIRQDIRRDDNTTSVYRNGVLLGSWPVGTNAMVGDKMFLNSGVPNGSGGSNCWKNLRVYVSP